VALTRAPRQPVPFTKRLKRIKGLHLFAVLIFFFVLVLIDRSSGLPYAFPFVASLLALIAVVVYGWFSGSEPDPTETVDIILENSGGNVYEFQPKNREQD
jgi:hypothetical protein